MSLIIDFDWMVSSKAMLTQVMRAYSHARSLITQSNIQSVLNDQRSLWNKKKLPLEFKAYWSFRMTSDLTCLETYKNFNTMHFVKPE